MKYLWRIFIILVGFAITCEVWSIENFMHLSDAEVEKIVLKKVKGATREGKILKLQTTAGTVTFENRINVGEGSAKYYLAGFRNHGNYFYLIRVIGYESKGYIILNKNTGQMINLYAIPVFSLDGKRFVDVSLDLDAGYLPNRILIFGLTENKYTVEWKYNYRGMKGPSNPIWLNNSSIVFFEVNVNNASTSPGLTKIPYIIEWKNEKWNLPRLLK